MVVLVRGGVILGRRGTGLGSASSLEKRTIGSCRQHRPELRLKSGAVPSRHGMNQKVEKEWLTNSRSTPPSRP